MRKTEFLFEIEPIDLKPLNSLSFKTIRYIYSYEDFLDSMLFNSCITDSHAYIYKPISFNYVS